ncbi:MAG: cytochrome [Desulfomicrobiaceae bacterium]|jgi:thiosulfate reductase cytochrome b subunit|uniref:cytochrome b/b6 domain-containing protein n=1 Tax=Thermodesulfomicrobium sp. WS TaxID=3004129 RepID=UPI000EDDBC31|nr:cytochrome b/b6 domain-containing protein [Thermodesulfomicrobium sp. WS]MBC7356387.1 cytochrome b/b6 domain-containing protein [Desulfomicrobiaceae bacterium]MBZ4648571.1 cytochrome [Desulfomicrobiaceae bacterium]MBZ4685755.1 cytochrome [Desulfomicrobiaceae bacterium]BDV00396.1 cytochrome b561 [Thermodesulfomicrobium sp. WS]HCF05570.1 cytochrome B [Desulfomicrobiaceae bacterium]
MAKTKIYLYTRFERFWHWLQAIIIFVLLLTGFEVHGTYSLLGFHTAVRIHNAFGFGWVVLFAFIIFWVFTTGEWKQYIPTSKKLWEVVRYYTSGIFQGKPHPVQKTKEAKHNPLQRLTYLALTAVLLTLQMGTGLLYYLYNDWAVWGLTFLGLRTIALIHLACAFGILSFVIIHIYMTTTGHTLTSHIAAMISGWEEVDEHEVADWERAARR